MVTLPPPFTATYIPGYFWHVNQRALYSIKTGELKRIKFSRARTSWGQFEDGYRVSHLGKRKTLTLEYLNTLTLQDSIVPISQPPVIKAKIKSSRVDDDQMSISEMFAIDRKAHNRSIRIYNQP